MRVRVRVWILPALALWISGNVLAGIDLSDFDTDTMESMDDASQELESALASRDTQPSVANAEFIRDSLQWAEGYFTRKGNVADAVKWARQGRDLAAAIVTSAGQGDFDGASASYASLRRTCKSCHDAYKPPSL